MAAKVIVLGVEVIPSTKKKCPPVLGNITAIVAAAPALKK